MCGKRIFDSISFTGNQNLTLNASGNGILSVSGGNYLFLPTNVSRKEIRIEKIKCFANHFQANTFCTVRGNFELQNPQGITTFIREPETNSSSAPDFFGTGSAFKWWSANSYNDYDIPVNNAIGIFVRSLQVIATNGPASGTLSSVFYGFIIEYSYENNLPM
jgi:predicted choloylglycine hydrolase